MITIRMLLKLDMPILLPNITDDIKAPLDIFNDMWNKIALEELSVPHRRQIAADLFQDATEKKSYFLKM